MSIIRADARHIPLRDKSVQCAVTSPPYWGLRDYGTGTWEGGDEGCGHVKTANLKRDCSGGVGGGRDYGTRGEQPNTSSSVILFADICGKCGARRMDRQIGLEPTLDEYVATMVGVFREVWRVLRDDGTCWVNLGDCYASQGERVHGGFNGSRPTPQRTFGQKLGAPMDLERSGLKPKDLVGQPWRVAFALQADGWYLRSDIIWAKPNPMPESVTDRPTRSHEYLFLLTKSIKYQYDAGAIREPHVRLWDDTNGGTFGPRQNGGKDRVLGGTYAHKGAYPLPNEAGRNKRDVWTVNSEPCPAAHFATFPSKLIEPCILAGSRPGDICFDPFLGSGTVGKVCERLGRRWVGLELSEPYIEIAKQRTAQMGLI